MLNMWTWHRISVAYNVTNMENTCINAAKIQALNSLDTWLGKRRVNNKYAFKYDESNLMNQYPSLAQGTKKVI